jgi:hypothetical protein
MEREVRIILLTAYVVFPLRGGSGGRSQARGREIHLPAKQYQTSIARNYIQRFSYKTEDIGVNNEALSMMTLSIAIFLY